MTQIQRVCTDHFHTAVNAIVAPTWPFSICRHTSCLCAFTPNSQHLAYFAHFAFESRERVKSLTSD